MIFVKYGLKYTYKCKRFQNNLYINHYDRITTYPLILASGYNCLILIGHKLIIKER
jgi:hypothetical protein